jgi:conjugal transfer pilus assembly protein TraW
MGSAHKDGFDSRYAAIGFACRQRSSASPPGSCCDAARRSCSSRLPCLPAGAGARHGADYGQHGAVFAVIEPDLLAMIRNKLTRLQATGALERMNQEFARRSEARIRRPDPVAGSASTTPRLDLRSRDHDRPRRVRYQGQRDRARRPAGQPLDFVTVRQSLVFIDADDRDQLEWAMRRYTDLTAKIVMVKGAPLEAMTRWRRGSTSTRAAISPPVSASTRFLPSSNPPARSCACPRSVGIGRK